MMVRVQDREARAALGMSGLWKMSLRLNELNGISLFIERFCEGWVQGWSDGGAIGGESYGFACCDGPIRPALAQAHVALKPPVTPPK
jgi:hypothetical protein